VTTVLTAATVTTGGRGWAYGGALLGGAVSVAANVAHSYVPPPGAPAAWSPHTGAVVGAVFWPVALFVAIEILARTRWPDPTRWVVLRYAGLLPVALVAALVSYRHLAGLLAFYGEDPLTAALGPLAVDGLMVMATGALIATAPARHTGTPAGPTTAGLAGPADHRPARSGPDPEEWSGPDRVDQGEWSGPVRVELGDLLLVGRAVAAELAHAGRPLTRAALIEGVRRRGRAISTDRAGLLLRALREPGPASAPQAGEWR
jgi:hypothetical protein